MDLSSEKIKGNIKFDKRTRERKSVALLRRKYTTRQIMEIMELRRRQMGLAPEQTADPESTQEEHIEPKPSVRVKMEPWTPPPSEPQERFVQAEPVTPVGQSAKTVEAFDEPWYASGTVYLKGFAVYFSRAVIDGILTAGAFILFTVMLTHIMAGGAPAEYDQGPFIFMAFVLTAWTQRRRLNRGKRSMVMSSLALMGGLAIFAWAAFNGLVYVQLLGFMLTAFGIFCGRHSKEAAKRLMFPLACLAFAIAPPESWAAAAVPQLNEWIAQGSSFFLRFLQIPSSWSGNAFSAGGYEFLINADLAGYRSIVAALPLAALYAYYRSARKMRKGIVILSVIPLVLAANIIHLTGTGWAAYTYGNPYADGFYALSGVIVFAVLGLFVLIDSLFNQEHDI
jgi:exosortase